MSHCKDLEAINLARDNGVRMVSLPPHTTHCLWPLDVSFFGPVVGIYYNQAIDKWLRTHTGWAVTTWQFPELFGEAYSKATSVHIAVSGHCAWRWHFQRQISLLQQPQMPDLLMQQVKHCHLTALFNQLSFFICYMFCIHVLQISQCVGIVTLIVSTLSRWSDAIAIIL